MHSSWSGTNASNLVAGAAAGANDGTHAPVDGGAGSRPRKSGLTGSVMSTNEVPLLRPMIAYSLPVVESVHPHTSFPAPPPIAVSGMLASMSTLLQGYTPAIPPTQGTGAAAAWPAPRMKVAATNRNLA